MVISAPACRAPGHNKKPVPHALAFCLEKTFIWRYAIVVRHPKPSAAENKIDTIAAANTAPMLWRIPIARLLPTAPLAGALLCALLCLLLIALRAAGTLGGPSLRPLLPLGFVLMMALPWILLSAEGRARIGLQAAPGPSAYGIGVAGGAAAALFCFALGMLLYGAGADNWFVSVAAAMRGAVNPTAMSLPALQLVLTLPALIFSPIGEEIFFRGFLQRALEQGLTVRAATLVEAGLFGLVHLCHHGLSAGAAGLSLHAVSGALWVLLMFGTALLFAGLRRRYDSLLPAMAAHAAFNLTMNAAIFLVLW